MKIMSNFIKDGYMLRLPRWHFKFKLVPSLITLLCLLLFVHLGCWQLRRAAEKEALSIRLQEGAVEVLDIERFLEKPEKEKRYQMIQLQGQFADTVKILLDNQLQQGKTGYRVLNVFLPENSRKYLLVDRGWIPLGENGRNLSQLELPALPLSAMQIHGRIDYPSQGFVLKNSDVMEVKENVLRVQNINISLLSNFFEKPFYPFILKLNQDSPYALEASDPILPMPAAKHLGYALQWFTMAAMTVLYFGFISLKKMRNNQ